MTDSNSDGENSTIESIVGHPKRALLVLPLTEANLTSLRHGLSTEELLDEKYDELHGLLLHLMAQMGITPIHTVTKIYCDRCGELLKQVEKL